MIHLSFASMQDMLSRIPLCAHISFYLSCEFACRYPGGVFGGIIIVVVVVRKLFKRFPLFQGNTDMLDNVMDFSPRDKNKLIFSSSSSKIL